MFGLFDSDIKRVRKLRLEYEDIRQRVLHKMNPYEQYSFLSGYRAMADQLHDRLGSMPENDPARWRQFGDELKGLAQQAWQKARRMPGIAGEGGVAGANGLALLAIRCSAKAYPLAEALTLSSDITVFEAQVEKLVDDQKPRNSN